MSGHPLRKMKRNDWCGRSSFDRLRSDAPNLGADLHHAFSGELLRNIFSCAIIIASSSCIHSYLGHLISFPVIVLPLDPLV